MPVGLSRAPKNKKRRCQSTRHRRYCLQFPGVAGGGVKEWLLPSPAAIRRLYWTTVTARRFWLQQEMSLQIATGRSLPNDLDVIRPALTPRATR